MQTVLAHRRANKFCPGEIQFIRPEEERILNTHFFALKIETRVCLLGNSLPIS